MSTEKETPEIEQEAIEVPKSLHELNMEQHAIDRQMREVNEKAADAANKAVLGVLNKYRPDGKRTQKPLRGQTGE